MIRGSVTTLALLVLSTGVLVGQKPPMHPGTVREGKLWFDGRATAGDFTGVTTTVTGAMEGAAELSAVRGWVEAPVNTLKTGNDHRDRDLNNKSMESDKYPVIRFELEQVQPGEGPADSMAATLHGRMLIHGETREVALPSILSFSPDGVRVRSTFPLNLKDYKIGGLSRALGLFKMYPDIVVHVDVSFQSR
jgi:polyisoprenoid-binding protein YceI